MSIEVIDQKAAQETWDGEFTILTEKEVRAGGAHRSDEDNNIYWLDLHQLAEYERADVRIKSDDEFWTWFAKFRDEKGIAKKRGRVWEERSYGSSFSAKGKDYVSKWWNDWGWHGTSSSTTSDDLARRLAVALGAVSTTVKVINETGKPWSVRLASKDVREAPTSFTNFEEHQIVISPQALLDTTIDAEQGIRVTTGYGLHEGSHVEYTEPLIDVLRKPTQLEPLLVASTGLNILEDDRIESLTSDKFPGFAKFFDEMLAYLWQAGKGHHPSKWDGTELPNKLNCIIAATRWAEEFRPIVDASGDAKLVDIFDWCQGWRDDYHDGRVGPRESLEALLAKLNEDPETKTQCQQQTADEQAQHPEKLSDEEFEDLLKQLKAGKGILEPCPSPRQGQPITLSEEQAAKVQDLLEQQLSITQTKLTFPDAYAGVTPLYVVTKPKESEESRDLFSKPKPSLVEKMRNAFFFRRPKMSYAERMLRSGQVDEDGLWRVADSDYRVFERMVQDPERSTAVTMLIDSSGSMAGRKLVLAQELAIVMLECLKTMTGVRAMVRAHTSDTIANPNSKIKNFVSATNIYRIWEPGDPIARLGLLNSDAIDHNANWDGFSIQYCLEEMVKNARPDEQQLLIVISDGLPNGDGQYSGEPAMKHMRRVVDHFEQQTGVVTVQIAIDPYGLKAADQAKMFRYWIPFESQDKLPIQLTNLLIKLFGGHQ